MNAKVLNVSKSYSYQHLQGIMLMNLNKIAYELNLSHLHYRILASLISFWNMELNIAYPSVEQLSKVAGVSKSTIVRSIKTLESLNLLVINRVKGKQSQYQLGYLLLNYESNPVEKLQTHITCKTAHEIKPNRTRTHKNINNDVNFVKNKNKRSLT